ncbi:protein of unknown function [Methanoculleus bourgensis]|uniref:Uncharacterized protein n=1 Tax=Methanoculleus bourgensis TaxID=83986 RepID=A0A0X3BPF7_9EURY|nr:protein of unknown function [Methanoculleus bourgensis]
MTNEDTSLRKLQLVELGILLELKRICEKHHIQYFLMGGTFLVPFAIVDSFPGTMILTLE